MKNWSLVAFLGGCLLLGLLGTGCNSAPATAVSERYGFQKINAYVRYLAARQELYGEITFRTDSTQQLKAPVLLNETPLTFRRRPKVGLQYLLNAQVPEFDRKQTFSYQEKDGSSQTITLALPTFDEVALVSGAVLSQTKGGLLGWKGEAFDKLDGMVLLFTDAEGQTFSVNHSGKTNGTQYQILSNVVQRLALGRGQLDVTRKRIEITETNGLTQWTTIEYYLPPIFFDVQP